MSVLRDHGLRNTKSPTEGVLGADICMHFGPPPVRTSRTTGSLIVQLLEDDILLWVTGKILTHVSQLIIDSNWSTLHFYI